MIDFQVNLCQKYMLRISFLILIYARMYKQFKINYQWIFHKLQASFMLEIHDIDHHKFILIPKPGYTVMCIQYRG